MGVVLHAIGWVLFILGTMFMGFLLGQMYIVTHIMNHSINADEHLLSRIDYETFTTGIDEHKPEAWIMFLLGLLLIMWG